MGRPLVRMGGLARNVPGRGTILNCRASDSFASDNRTIHAK